MQESEITDGSEYCSLRMDALGVGLWLTPWGCQTSISGALTLSSGHRRTEVPGKGVPAVLSSLLFGLQQLQHVGSVEVPGL